MRIILCLLLALCMSPAWAEWFKIGAAKDGSVTAYIESAKIRKNGNYRKSWEILEFKKRDEFGVISRRALMEYDCKEQQARILWISVHSEPMAGGDSLLKYNVPSDEWRIIPPGSIAEATLEIVCTK